MANVIISIVQATPKFLPSNLNITNFVSLKIFNIDCIVKVQEDKNNNCLTRSCIPLTVSLRVMHLQYSIEITS